MLQENEIYSEIVEACNIFSISNSITQNEKRFSKKLRAAILPEIPGFGGYRLKISLSLTILQIMMGFVI